MYDDINLPFQNTDELLSVLEQYLTVQLDYLEEYFSSHSILPNSTKLPYSSDFAAKYEQILLYYASKTKASTARNKPTPFYLFIHRHRLTKFQVHCIMTSLICMTSPSFAHRMVQNGLATAYYPSIYGMILLFRTHDSLSIDAKLWDELAFVTQLFWKKDTKLHLHTFCEPNSYALSYVTKTPPLLPYYITLFHPKPSSSSDIDKLFCDLAQNLPSHTILLVYGQKGSGRKEKIKMLAQSMQSSILFVDCSLLCLLKEEEQALAFQVIETVSLLYTPWICLKELDSPQHHKLRIHLQRLENVHLLGTSTTEHLEDFDGFFSIFPYSIAPLSLQEQCELWKKTLTSYALSHQINFTEFAGKFSMTPSKILSAAREAYFYNQQNDITSAALAQCCYHQTEASFSTNAEKIKTVFTWDNLVLPQTLKNAIRQGCNHIRYHHTVYNEWDFASRFSYGTGVSMLFAGPPGTGKTMAAQVIAKDLEMDLYRIDLSTIVSKYIGETEKNLNQIFEEAKNSHVILFFDEMDALFGKRSETQDAKDKYANMETAFLLQKVEEYDGVILLATNYLTNIDEAFIRRISFIFHFPLPVEKYRLELWEKSFPPSAPLQKGIDFPFLAKKFEISGAVIKNIALSAAFLAAANQTEITMEWILKSAAIELSKQGKILLKEDYGQYAYLLEGGIFYESRK